MTATVTNIFMWGDFLIKKPILKPMHGMVEIEHNGNRVYKNVKTGAIIRPGEVLDADAEEQMEFLSRFRRTDEYALLEYVFMMEGIL